MAQGGGNGLEDSQTRRVLRALFTKELNALEDLLTSERELSRAEVVCKLVSLSNRRDKILKANEEMETQLMAKTDLEDDVLLAEYERCTEYEVRYLYVQDLAEEFIQKARVVSPSHSHVTVPGVVGADVAVQSHDVSAYLKHKFKPEITRKFDGDLGNWIGFWTQFERVHTSEKWTDDEKFDILLKGLKPETAAARLVARFPPSAENYKKAVELLKSRFGREENLIEYYVRKLLSLVLTKSDSRPVSELYDDLEVQLQALDSLKVTKEKYAAMLFPLVESAVPESIFRVWERYRVTKDASMKEPADCLTELLSFLQTEVEGEERLKLRKGNFSDPSPAGSTKSPPVRVKVSSSIPTAASLVSTDEVKVDRGDLCIFCDNSHPSPQCAAASDMTLSQRNELVKKKGACFKCLKKSGHLSAKCKLIVKCVLCKGRHYPLMCQKVEAHPVVEKKEESSVTSSALLSGGKIKSGAVTFLQTLVAKVVLNGRESRVRILLDSGSQKSYIVKSCVKNLKLSRQSRVLIQQEVFGGSRTTLSSHGVYSIKLKSLDESFEGQFEVLDQDRICSFVPQLQDVALYYKLKERGIDLSDFSETSHEQNANEIQVLLGADAWAKVITTEHVEVEPGLLAINTKLGWTLLGSKGEKSTIASALLVTLTCHTNLSNFWDLELMGIRDSAVKITQEDKDRQVQEFFEETTKIEDGRYTVSLPWIEGHAPLEDNMESAHRRLKSVTRRLQDNNLYEDYNSVFHFWVEHGIVEVVPEDEVTQFGHYLPHRPVIKDGSTTRVRPVFDASNKDRNGNSLNNSLEKGPNLIELIPMILINFRLHRIGVSADIEKAFLMISLAKRDRDFLRFLWWKDGELLVLRHCRVVFGVAPSPYLLGAVLQHLLRNVDASFMQTAEKLKKSFYVDNCLTSVDSEDDLNTFTVESQQILASVGFNLRGWVSNLKNPEKIENVLGLLWFCGSDEIGLNVKSLWGVPTPLTRRVLLSIAQRLYDPIGFCMPVSLVPKILLQKAWCIKGGWDDPLPQEICQGFLNWVEEIPSLSDCKIKRHILTNETSTMHVFCDASKLAAAACVFIRTEIENKVFVNLVMAKSRVAPSNVTIPRLELIAALIGARLYKLVCPGFTIEPENTFFWSDSSVVISWIKNTGPWTVFVANRVNEIKGHSDPAQWRHIPGCLNPADLISRGCTPRQLAAEKWWEGPSWLHFAKIDWPSSDETPAQSEVDREKRKTVVSAPTTQVLPSTLLSLAERISSYYVIVKVIMHVIDALCIICPEFVIHSGLDSSSVVKRGFSAERFANAELALLRSIQREHFDENVKHSALKGFTVFKDDSNLLRLRTRILDEEHSEEFSCPIVLPGKNPLVMRLIEYQHLINNHSGVLTLLTILRERFWLIRGRQAVGMVVRRCVICRKNQAQPLQVPMPPLPTDRTKTSSTFQITGVDLAGPIFLKDKGKAWIVLFTCAVYRATHLELIQSLSTEAFIQALRRFIARRGRPKTFYSDNGTNFVGLDNLFRKIDWNVMEKECCVQRIRWKFNPPTASWWGGFWERLVRILKDLLKKNLGHASLEYEEMTTMLCECEALMNNRPLTYLAEDPSQLVPLTPSMFLQSLVGNDVVDLDQIESTCLEKKWTYLQSVREGLKKRFSKEYLGMLRNARPKRTDVLNVGDIVLVGSDNKRRLEWPLAKVLELKPGRDGVTRLAKLLTKNGEILRPLQRIYPLEIHGELVDCGSASDCPLNPELDEEPNEDGKSTDEDFSQEEDESQDHMPREETTRSGRVVKPRQILDL